jgi:hypothetical protein
MTATTARRRTGAIAAAHLGGNDELVSAVKSNFERAEISEKLKALLAIADQVQQGGKHVQPADIDRAPRRSLRP